MENGGVCKSSWIDNGSIESHRFYLARRTTLEMLRDRGYNVSNSDIDLSLTQFRAKFTQKPNLTDLKIELPLKSNSSKKVAVLFCGTEKITKPMVGTLFNEGGKIVGLSRMILILQSDMTAQARQDLNLCRVKVETFHISDLLVNITKHVLMPKHEILTSAEKDKILKKFNLEDKQVPRMLETDAVAKYYGLQKGQMVKVTHIGDDEGTHINYRCVM